MKQIKLITLTHDCCAVCEGFYLDYCRINCKEDGSHCNSCVVEKTNKHDNYCPEITNPHNTICEGNFKRKK